jgi:hypothetical protein
MIKSIFAVGALLCCAVFAQAQSTTVTVSYITTDASQFGYESWDKGIGVAVTRKLSERWEVIASGAFSDAQKAYVGDGKHADGSLGARFYLGESVFLTAGGTLGADWNSQYTKRAIRGFIGIGGKAYGFTGTLTAFSPPSDISIDANQVRGINLLVEYIKPLFGPLSAYTSFQTSLASFNQTGGDLSMRFSGVIWKGRAGICFSF